MKRPTVPSLKTSLGIDKMAYKQKMNELKQKVLELEAVNWIERVNELEALATRLSEQVENYEVKYMLVALELERTTQVIIDKSNEVEKWKKLYIELEEKNKRDIEKLKNEYEKQLARQIESQVTELARQFAGEKKNLEDQINQAKEHAQREAREKSSMNNHIGDLRKKIAEQEEALKMFATEITRLKEVNANQGRDVEFWKNKSGNLEKQMKDELEKARNQAEIAKNMAVENERREGMGRLAAEKSAADSQIKTLKGKILDLENARTYLEKELARLKKNLADKDAEIEELKAKYSRLEIKSKSEFEEIRIEFENYKMTAIDPNEFEKRFAAERAAYETQILQLNQKIKELETKLALAIGENDKLNRLTTERLREIEAFKLKYVNSVSAEEAGELRRELEKAKSNNSAVNIMTLKFKTEIRDKDSEIKRLKELNADLQKDKEDAWVLIESGRNESETSSTVADKYKLEISQLKQAIQRLEGELLSKDEKYHSMARELEEARRERDVAKMHSDNVSREIALKNRELMEKFKEMDDLKAQYEKVLRENQEGMHNKIAKMSIVVGQDEYHSMTPSPHYGNH